MTLTTQTYDSDEWQLVPKEPTEAMLDTLGNPSACSVDDFEANPFGLHPVFAMGWFKALLVASKAAYRAQSEGYLCSTIPRSFSSYKIKSSNYSRS